MDIIVTTPKSQSENAAKEADEVKENGGGFYFRIFHRRPKNLESGDRIFYVEDGYIRGFAKVLHVQDISSMECDVTGKTYTGRCCAFMDASTWTWVRPIEMKGFQGWRYCQIPENEIIVAGDWMDPKPEI